MRVLKPEEMASVDRAAIDGGIPGIELMEKAGRAVSDTAMEMISYFGTARISIWCGKGNNGGDGFVAARYLHRMGHDVYVYLLCSPEDIKGDALANYELITTLPVPVIEIEKQADIEKCSVDVQQSNLIIDAIFGTGFSGEPKGIYGAAIEFINKAGVPVLSVDIPSGVSGDTGAVPGAAVSADKTVTFAALKLGLVQYPGKAAVGELEVVDIGIPENLLGEIPESNIYLVEEEDADAMLPTRKKDAHKGDSGRVLVVGGSPGMTGAAAMTARAALRSGAGLVTACVPEGLNDIYEVKLTEVMTVPVRQTVDRTFSLDAAKEILGLAGGFEVLAIGPGISRNNETAGMVRELVAKVRVPVVLDADGLNAMVGHTDIFKKRKAPLVITPHPGEMSRLLGVSSADVQADRVAVASGSSAEWGIVVVLKGAQTVTADPSGAVKINASGNQGMASAGMGDVLTGCIAALIAQGCAPFDAAAAGVFFHGFAADLVANMDAMIGMVAGDVIRYLPMAMRQSE